MFESYAVLDRATQSLHFETLGAFAHELTGMLQKRESERYARRRLAEMKRLRDER
jgi:hypothetical protein